jgi:hypothetical protein
MRTIKLILGVGCFIVAFLLGVCASWLFLSALSHLDGPEKGFVFCIVLALAVFAISFGGAGWFLIVRRNSTLSQKARILILLPFLCFAILTAGASYFIKSRSTSAVNACVNNLRQIDAAALEFALEKAKRTGEAINYPNDLTPYINIPMTAKFHHVRKAVFILSKKLASLRPVRLAPPSLRPTFCPEPVSSAVRREIFVALFHRIIASSVGAASSPDDVAPDGAGDIFSVPFYKDAAPTALRMP